jgi:hypothetical protein
MASMQENLELVQRFFDVAKWEYEFDKEDETIFTGFSGENIDIKMMVGTIEEDIVCIANFPVKVPESRRNAVAILLSEINFGLRYGRFELDFEDGEVNFRVTLMTDGIQPSHDMIGKMIVMSCTSLDNFGLRIMAVISGEEVLVKNN